MADITMCMQTQCPSTGHCLRVQATPGKWQSTGNFHYTVSERGVECENYIPMRRGDASNVMMHNYQCPYCGKAYQEPGTCQHGAAKITRRQVMVVPSTRYDTKQGRTNNSPQSYSE